MKWITRERPKIDRIACPWLIKNFIDKEAEFIYVPLSEVKKMAKKLGAIPFDIPDVEFTHYGTAAAIGAITEAVIIIGKKSLIDVPTILMAVTTAFILFRYKKVQEPYIILVAAIIGLILKFVI
jgi:hypothetical protein